jgi:nicotinamide riboside kinase
VKTHTYVLTGPESSGKTTLAKALARYWSVPLVHEQSRLYLEKKRQEDSAFKYQESDLLAIARQQHDSEIKVLADNPMRLVCDTDLLVMIIWSEVKFGKCDPWILDTFSESLNASKRHYLLCDWQIPWEADEWRENPEDRRELFRHYQLKLKEYGIIYTAVGGSTMQRLRQIFAAVYKNEL